MDYRNFADPAVAGDSATLFVPLELSGQSWLVGLYSAVGAKQMSIHKLAAGDMAGVLALIARAVGRLRAACDREVKVLSCYEAGRDGFWPDRELRARAITNLVIDPASIEMPRRARRAKTDRVDLKGLLRVLLALVRGESDCRIVRVPSIAEEDARRPGRERERLVRERGQHINRLKSLCALHGTKAFEPLRADRRARLAELRTAGGAPLPAHQCGEMEHELTRLELVLEQIKEVEGERDALARRAPAPAPAVSTMSAPARAPVASEPAGEDAGRPMIQALVKLKAIGPELATRLIREAFYRCFTNRRQVGAFFGLDGSPWRSGGIAREQGISKSGNRRARVAAIELAWLWVRFQPESALSRWFQARAAGQTRAVRCKAIVALARKLMIALWRYVRLGLVPEGAVFKPHVTRA